MYNTEQHEVMGTSNILATPKDSVSQTSQVIHDVNLDNPEISEEIDRLADCASRNEVFSEWYALIVLNNTERSSSQKLTAAGHKNLLATQTYFSIWKDGRRKKRERILIPRTIFVRCTQEERLRILRYPYVVRFMTDRAGRIDTATGKHPFVKIPERQMRQFMYMLDKADSEILFTEYNIQKGMTVRVMGGALEGLEGIVTEFNSSKTRVYINIDFLGSASVLIDTDLVKHIN